MADKLQLEIPVLLPDIPDQKDACVLRLVANLREKNGVDSVHVVDAADDQPAKLCIHYDPNVLPLTRIRQQARRLGAELTDQFGHVVWAVKGITHQRRARTIAQHIRDEDGVVETAVTAGLVRIEFDRKETHEFELREKLGELRVYPERIRELRSKSDYDDRSELEEAEEHVHGDTDAEWTELFAAIMSGVLVSLGFALSFINTIPASITLAIFVGAYAFGGFFAVREALDNIRVGRFEIDFLMLVAATGAAILGAWLEGAFLLFLFSLGHSLEHYAMGRARRAVEALAEAVPDRALVRRDGVEQEVGVENLSVGDVVIVKTNERLPIDGFVLAGTGTVNQAPVTGESVPADKSPVVDPEVASQNPDAVDAMHRVFAGTINGSGVLEVVVTKRSSESTLTRMVRMVTEAETQASDTERFTERFERIFVPSVIAVAVLLLFAGVLIDEPFSASFYRTMAVLVAASPCALAISTPSAVLSAVARAGRAGVLIKGGRPLENLGVLGAIAFDKTGTITHGKPRVTDVVPAEGSSDDDLLMTAVAVERLSDHPLAEAVVRYGNERSDSLPALQVRDLEGIPGRGVRAVVNGEMVYIGKDDLFAEIDGPALPKYIRDTIENLEEGGRTTMIVRRGETYLGVLGLMDTQRESAIGVLKQLRTIGIRRLIMISGDNQRVAEAIGMQVGFDEAYADLMPDDKVEAIKVLSKEEHVAMVGDGVNDAPAMAHATVGIAMGAAGSDVALETADVALMADDLTRIPFAVELSRRARRIIRQNLWVSLGIVAVLVPATMFGLDIGPAVAFHEGSTVVVVFNALRLLTE